MDNYRIPFISMNTNKVVEVEVNATFSLQSTPVLTRERPEAYLIAATYPEIIQKLRLLGVEVNQLQEQQTMEVENYTVTSWQQEYISFEKFYPVRVQTEVATIRKEFPAGTYRVPMDQLRSNVAVSVLEPEAANGFINYRVYETGEGEELPVYRQVN